MSTAMSMRFAHVSDLHVGRSWMFSPELLNKAIDLINDSEIDVVLVTGDLTDWGLREEYERFKGFLDLIEGETLLIPGNHDARIAGYKVFEEMFCKEAGRFRCREFGDVAILALDSSEPDIDDGHIGREQLEWMRKRLDEMDREKRVPVVALHHHIVPVPNTGRERNILVDSGDVLEVLDRYDVPLVVTGHKHNPWVWQLNDMTIYNGGTVSCKRTAVSNALSHIEIDHGHLRIERIGLPGNERTVMVDRDLQSTGKNR